MLRIYEVERIPSPEIEQEGDWRAFRVGGNGMDWIWIKDCLASGLFVDDNESGVHGDSFCRAYFPFLILFGSVSFLGWILGYE
jgi:hypothetical protein